MGGGGDFGPSKDDLSYLEKVARDVLRDSARPTKCNLFISFVAEDLSDVSLLRGQAKNESSDLEFNDWSLREPYNSERAEYIKRGIRERINHSSATLVYVSEQTAHSKWVDWEIRESIRLGKGVVAVYKGQSPPRTLPPAIRESSIQVIPWTQTGLVAAIKKASEACRGGHT
jgi:hypothetical protein